MNELLVGYNKKCLAEPALIIRFLQAATPYFIQKVLGWSGTILTITFAGSTLVVAILFLLFLLLKKLVYIHHRSAGIQGGLEVRVYLLYS